MDLVFQYLSNLPPHLTSQQIDEIFTSLENITTSEQFRNAARPAFLDQENREKELFLTSLPCRDNIGYVRTHLFGLTPPPLKELAQTQFYNPELSRALTCITDAIIHGEETGGAGAPYYARILRWYNRLHQIGQESVNGTAFDTSLADVEGLYVLKVAKPTSTVSLLHEYLVGTLATNRLRGIVPNFSYIYGAFNCAPPLTRHDNKEVVAWCTNTTPITYIVYENISPSRTFRDILETENIAPPIYLSFFLQIVFALRTAFLASDFTHFDLHTENVLLREIPSRRIFYIPYPTDQGRKYLLSNRIATIIDYGSAHFKYEGASYGVYTLAGNSVLPNNSNIMGDIYKLLLFSASEILRNPTHNPATLELVSRLIRFFNPTERLENIIQDQENTYYTWPSYNPQLTVDGFLTYLRTQYSQVGTILESRPTRPSVPVLNCQNLTCLSQPQVFEMSGMINGKIPTSFFDLYDLLLQYKDPAQQRQILDRFPYSQRIVTTIPLFLEQSNLLINNFMSYQTDTITQVIPNLPSNEQESVRTLIRSTQINPQVLLENLWLHDLPPALIFTPGLFALYRYKVYRIADLYFRFVKLRIQQVSILSVAVVYQDTVYAPQISDLLENIIPLLPNIVANFTSDNETMKSLRDTTDQSVVDLYRWYWDSLEILLQLLR